VLTVTSQRRQRQKLAQDEYGDEADADLRDKDPPSIPEEYEDKANMAFDYIQASKAKMNMDKYAKVKRDFESDDDLSHSEFGARPEDIRDYKPEDIRDYESEDISDYEFQRPATMRSRERRIPVARPS
jgi:hypothetical protein